MLGGARLHLEVKAVIYKFLKPRGVICFERIKSRLKDVWL